ncbi:MAG TPA: hypothetical protein VLJ44_13525 [Gaiellaceae bacterium]|nr:hypothetical protein [Gaiellaceae bacterium]
MQGGVDGNERLTASNALVLLVLLALEGATLVAVQQLLVPHVFLGFLLIPPIALKLGSTGWRLLSYYRGNESYVRRGPPQPFLRFVVGPLVVVSTISLFASGVAVVATGRHGLLLGLHKASFIVWVAAMSAHVLWHVWKLPRLAFDRLPGRGLRLAVIGAALGAGLVLAVATMPLADHWQDRATGALGIDRA